MANDKKANLFESLGNMGGMAEPKFDTNVEVNDIVNVDINVDSNVEVNEEKDQATLERLKRMEEIQRKREEEKKKKKESNKQVTVYLTPENYKQFNKLKGKGEKSDFINDLLNTWFGH